MSNISERGRKAANDEAHSENQKKFSAKKYLISLRKMDYQIEQKREEIERIKATAAGISAMAYDGVCVQTSSRGDRMEAAVARYVDKERELLADIDRLTDATHVIINQIHWLENPDYVRLLHMRYVQYKQLEEISVEMGYSYQYVRILHGRALQEFERIYAEKNGMKG